MSIPDGSGGFTSVEIFLNSQLLHLKSLHLTCSDLYLYKGILKKEHNRNVPMSQQIENVQYLNKVSFCGIINNDTFLLYPFFLYPFQK
jgi:hypothetical protein